MEVCARYPGSCGEIIQGHIHGKDMLISCPVDLFTTVRVFECKKPANRFKYIKSSALLHNMLKRWGLEHLNGLLDIDIESSIPQSKGFASSTADLCGVYICLLKLFKRKYDITEAIEEFVKIEPTDSIIFREMALFDYKDGGYYERIGDYLKFYILAFEGRRIIDTVAYNKKKLPKLSDLSDIFPLVEEGIKSADISKIAVASTASIKRNLNRLPYDVYGAVLNICNITGGLGIIGGHSGDVLGIIYDDKE
ncbi:MAG TPA: kinase, partial [Clostridiaceae bacterium]|nr:kinase [Clostridiaceae bacterium]